MKTRKVLLVAIVLLACFVSSLAQAKDVVPVTKIAATPRQQHSGQSQPARTQREIEAAIRRFWDALGRYDAEGLKATVDWPLTIVEASSSSNKQSVLRSPQEIDEEFNRSTSDAARRKGKSEFYGTSLLDFRINMLNTDLASVTYVCRLPRDIVGPSRSDRFNALTVLRKDSSGEWKIIFITVPK